MYLVKWLKPRHLFFDPDSKSRYKCLQPNDKIVEYTVCYPFDWKGSFANGALYKGVGDRFLTSNYEVAKKIAAYEDTTPVLVSLQNGQIIFPEKTG